jgi:hypothetical protein
MKGTTVILSPLHNLSEAIVAGFIFYFLKDAGLAPVLAALVACPGFAVVKLVKHLATSEEALKAATLKHIGIDFVWEVSYTVTPWILVLVDETLGRLAWFVGLWLLLWSVRSWLSRRYQQEVGWP